MSFTPPDRDYLRDILEAAKAIAEYVHGMTEADFQQDRKCRDAVERNLEIMGEATKRLSGATRQATADIPWQRMAGMRDVLIHAYDHIEPGEVWRVAIKDVPEIIERLEPLAGGM